MCFLNKGETRRGPQPDAQLLQGQGVIISKEIHEYRFGSFV